MSEKPAPKTPSIDAGPWSPFRTGAFAILWTATVISNVGTWMHDVGAGWLMTELTASPLVVAMVQSATTLPVFLFALLAGAIADIVDRRLHLIIVNLLMGVVAVMFAVVTYLNLMTPTLLIVMTFLLGTGAAFMAPAWQAVVPSIVDRPQLPAAIALNSMGINVSRAIGPALAGFLIVSIGLAAPFVVNAFSFVIIVAALIWWRPAIPRQRTLPPEKISQAIAAGFKYAANSGPVKNTLLRAAAFFVFASAFWALLPLIARDTLSGGATLYGALLAAVGIGAVGGAIALPKLRKKWGVDKTVAIGTLGAAMMMVVLSMLPVATVAVAACVVIGVSWIAVLSSLHISMQTSLPEWVRARGLSIFLTVFFGAMSGGSLLWGQVASMWSIDLALIVAALGAVVMIPLTWRAKLGGAAALDLAPALHWPEPIMSTSSDETPDQGPVMVQVVYRVGADNVVAFGIKMRDLAAARRRNGAFQWSLMQDTKDQSRFVETWFEASWVQHLRHHERVTASDRALQDEVRALLIAGTEPEVTHHLGLSD